jgi:hypothetical protein
MANFSGIDGYKPMAVTLKAASHNSQSVKLFSSFSVSFGQPNLHAAIHQGSTSPMS